MADSALSRRFCLSCSRRVSSLNVEARVQFEYETQRTGRLQLPLSEVIDYQLRLLCWIIVKQTTVLIHLPVPTVDHIKIN